MQLAIKLDRRVIKIFITFLLIVNVLLIVGYLVNYLIGEPIDNLTELINLDGEANIPSWYSASQLLLVSITIFAVIQNQNHQLKGAKAFWYMLSLGFLFLSFDEGAVFHEKITAVFKRWEWIPRFQGDHGIWIFFYGGLIILILILSIRQIRSFYANYPVEFFVFSGGIIMYVLGAVGIEILGYQFFRYDETSFAYIMQVIVEELFELTGTTIILYSFLRFFTKNGSATKALEST